MGINNYIYFFFIITLLSFIIFFIIFYVFKKLYTHTRYNHSLYYICMLTWIFSFVYLSYFLFKDGGIDEILYKLVFLMILTSPFGIIILLFTKLIVFILNLESFELIYSILITLLFISAYYQWFIWFPKYLRKKLKQGLNENI